MATAAEKRALKDGMVMTLGDLVQAMSTGQRKLDQLCNVSFDVDKHQLTVTYLNAGLSKMRLHARRRR